MSYKYTKGAVDRGDIHFEDDAAQTQIDWEDDYIGFKTGGNTVLAISGSLVGINAPGMPGNESSPIVPLDVHISSGSIAAIPGEVGGGEVVYFGGGTVVAGKAYYLHTDGNWTITDADAEASGASQLLGIAVGGGTASTVGVLLKGYFDADAHLAGTFSAGKPVYLASVAGGYSVTAPSGTDKVVRIIGYCTSHSNVIWFNPSSTSLVLS